MIQLLLWVCIIIPPVGVLALGAIYDRSHPYPNDEEER